MSRIHLGRSESHNYDSDLADNKDNSRSTIICS